MRAALHRAAHQLLDRPLVFADDVVLRLIGPELVATITPDWADQAAVRRLRATIALRSRYAEDRLADAVRRGVGQYLVLGAGLDSFAYRNPFPALRIFEVDHPASQAAKRRLLADAGIALPPTLTFVPVDFERERLIDALVRGGVDTSAQVFVSWLGVTVYLTREAVLETLAAVATLPAGSAIVSQGPGRLPNRSVSATVHSASPHAPRVGTRGPIAGDRGCRG